MCCAQYEASPQTLVYNNYYRWDIPITHALRSHTQHHTYILSVNVWESRKLRLYGENACPSPQPHSLEWDLGQDGKLWNRRNGRSGKLSHSDDVMHVVSCFNDVNVCGSAHCGCVVNGNVAMAALFEYYIIMSLYCN